MTDRQWRRVLELYESVSSLPAEAALAQLRSEDENPIVLRELRTMLEGSSPEKPDSFLTLGDPVRPCHDGAVIGRYDVITRIGLGSMGEVYSGRDRELQRPVALKFVSPACAGTGSVMGRFIREARAASALNHPNIVTIHEVITWESSPVIVMELVEGTSLRALLAHPLPAPRAIGLGRQLLQALAFAHANGVVHRDLKPENIMVRPDGLVKLLDMGLARRTMADAENLNFSSIPGMPVGTLRYMSPEQCRGEPAQPASDVFAAGIVLYETIAGRHPFHADSPLETAHAIVRSEPAPLTRWNRVVPASIDLLIGRMLHKDAAARPSAEEAAEALGIEDPRMAGSPQALRHGRPSAGWFSTRRVRWLMSAALSLGIGGAAAFLLPRTQLFAPKEPEFAQITTQAIENRVTAAALSPDAASLAFAALGGAVHLRRMSDGFTRPLGTPAGLGVDRIAWFSDGSRLLLSGSLSGQRSGIWVMPIHGGQPRLVAPDGKDGVPSPDGSRIALTSSGGSIIWTVAMSGGTARQVRGGGSTASFSSLIWSPDSKRIAYQRQEYSPPQDRQVDQALTQLEKNYQFSYESVDVATGRLAASVKDVVMTSACGLPDGRVLFLRWLAPGFTYSHQLWELRTDPRSGRLLGRPRRLTHNPNVMLYSVSASNDGRQVAVAQLKERPGVYIADVLPSGTVPRFVNLRRLSFADAAEFPHAWTADAQTVIFESDRNGHYQLYRQGIGQNEAEPVVLTAGDNILAQLSPDGEWVLYRSDQSPDDRRLMRVRVGGGTPQPVSIDGKLDEFRCGLKPGAGCVLRSIENDQFVFHALDPVRGEGRELARTVWSPTILGDWDVSPDGSQVAIPSHDPRDAKIRLIGLLGRQAGLEEKSITLNGLKYLNGVVWSADGRGWYVSVRTSAGLHPMVYADLEGRTSELSLESIAPMYAVPSPDGRHAAFPAPPFRAMRG